MPHLILIVIHAVFVVSAAHLVVRLGAEELRGPQAVLEVVVAE